jgi:predicted nucleic acid-binding protein
MVFIRNILLKKYGVKKIISFDGDFDKAEEIERIK